MLQAFSLTIISLFHFCMHFHCIHNGGQVYACWVRPAGSPFCVEDGGVVGALPGVLPLHHIVQQVEDDPVGVLRMEEDTRSSTVSDVDVSVSSVGGHSLVQGPRLFLELASTPSVVVAWEGRKVGAGPLLVARPPPGRVGVAVELLPECAEEAALWLAFPRPAGRRRGGRATRRRRWREGCRGSC